MSLDFIPTVWAARLLTALEESLVYGQRQVSNRDYEGEIREAGNTVKIASIGDVTIDDYTKDTDIAEPDVLSDDDQSCSSTSRNTLTFMSIRSTVRSRMLTFWTKRCAGARGACAKRPTAFSQAS